MKTIRLIPFILILFLSSCATISVSSDYDKNIDYSRYKTFGFYKPGVDKVEISDLDKKRILRAIENQLVAKGFTKSENPDILVNIFTKTREQINVNQFNAGWGYGWGFGWNPWLWGGNQTSVSRSTEGTLFIDLIDAQKKELVWQGEGQGELTRNSNKKEENINKFVAKVLEQYPPNKKQ